MSGLFGPPVSGDGWDQVFAIGGQSNADGRGALDVSTTPPHPVVWMLDKGGTRRTCSEPAGAQVAGWVNNIPGGLTPGNPTHSFATAAGKEVLLRTGVRPIMVPCAIGSTSLAHWSPPATEGDMTSLFGALVTRVQSVLASGATPVILWYGHEANSSDTTLDLATGALGSVYMDAWAGLVADLRQRFPQCPIIYCQLSATPVSQTAHMRTGEAQRRMESVYGDPSAAAGYQAITWDTAPSSWTPLNTNATNTVSDFGDGTARLVGDGSTALGVGIVQLRVGKRYRVSYTATGTGLHKIQANATQVGTAGRSAGSYTDTFVADGTGMWSFYRNSSGAAIDLRVRVTAVQEWDNSIMVVTHDVPRNAGADAIHVSGQGQREIGRRIGLAYAQRVLGLPVNGTGPRLVSCTKSSTDVVVKFDRTIQADANGYGASLAASLFRVYAGGSEQTLTACARDGSDTAAVRITCSAALSGTVVVTYGDRAGPSTEVYRPGCVYDTDGLPAPQMAVVAA